MWPLFPDMEDPESDALRGTGRSCRPTETCDVTPGEVPQGQPRFARREIESTSWRNCRKIPGLYSSVSEPSLGFGQCPVASQSPFPDGGSQAGPLGPN